MKICFKNTSDTRLEIEKLEKEKENEKKSKTYLYKLIQTVNSACDKNVNELKKLQMKYKTLQEVDAIKLLFDSTALILSSEAKRQFKRTVISSLLSICYNKCVDDNNELLFFASATFNIEKLKEIIKLSSHEEINQLRSSDTVIIFTLKYGDIRNGNFVECLKILIDAGVDVNKTDISGKFAIDYVALLHTKNENDAQVREKLEQVAQLLLEKGIFRVEDPATIIFVEDELKFSLTNYKYVTMDTKSRLFYYVSKNKIEAFTSFKKIRDYVNCDNGENTLLQFAANKSQKMVPVVQHLLKNGADPNRTTEVNTITPLEMAARNNYEAIFKEILNCKETKISEEQFCNFVKARGFSMKREFFGFLLESDKIDPVYVYARTGNTPLHYAIRLCHKNAIQKLLKRRDTCLTVFNNCGKSPLDILNATDLNIFLDSCLVFDNRHIIDFSSTEYKMQFRFRRLNDGSVTEVDVISQIGKHKQLEHLLAHPLIHTYVMLKWYKVQTYFWKILFLQAFLFLLLSFFFYHFPFASTAERIICFVLSLINIVAKCLVFFNPIEPLRNTLTVKPITTLHAILEILLMVLLIGGFFLVEFRSFVFINMAVLLLLTAGYHPKLAHWSIMLQKVFKTFTVLLIFFSLLMIAFAAGFHIMFEGHRFFTYLYRSVFMSYFMTIGEIDVSEVDFEKTPFGGYLLFFLFAMSMSVVIINFWTGVAIRDIDKFEKSSEVSALRNVIAFIAFVEKRLYKVNWLKTFLPNPLLFSDSNNQHYEVDFYPNKDDQFEPKYIKYDDKDCESVNTETKRRFPQRLHIVCFEKIKAHYNKQQTLTGEQKLMAKLDKILQSLEINGGNKNRIKRQITVV